MAYKVMIINKAHATEIVNTWKYENEYAVNK